MCMYVKYTNGKDITETINVELDAEFNEFFDPCDFLNVVENVKDFGEHLGVIIYDCHDISERQNGAMFIIDSEREPLFNWVFYWGYGCWRPTFFTDEQLRYYDVDWFEIALDSGYTEEEWAENEEDIIGELDSDNKILDYCAENHIEEVKSITGNIIDILLSDGAEYRV